jgi:group II intron reverse transcriptase/maturase
MSRKAGKGIAPLAQSKSQARYDMSSTREPGDPQLALPGMKPGEHQGEAPQGVSPRKRLRKSDESVVPEKPANKAQAAESVEGRDSAKRKSAQGNPHRTQGRLIDGATGLGRVSEKSRREHGKKLSEKERFTNLFTHLKADLLKAVFYRLKKGAAPGVDGLVWDEYEQGLSERLVDLQDRLHRGAYKPLPVRRTYIPKADGKQRPLGVPAIEDKVVQGAVVSLLTPVYEADFLESSYGFRPGRNQHMALEAVDAMMYRGKVNWVLDADIQSFFDTIDHDWMMRFLEHRIGDRRLLRLVKRWLKAGVMEDERLRATVEGTPQGGLISPLLANIYLHYVLDLWHRQEAQAMQGTAHLVRYADDFIVGFQHQPEAEEYQRRLGARLHEFGLTVHPTKTRLLRFGLFARQDCGQDGRKKPATFDFLGFTHISGVTKKGAFRVVRRTSRKKRSRKFAELKVEMRHRMHWKVADQWRWLASVLRGHYRYYGLPTNYAALAQFRNRVQACWHKTLQRRSQRARMTRSRLDRLDRLFPLPLPRILPTSRRLFPP